MRGDDWGLGVWGARIALLYHMTKKIMKAVVIVARLAHQESVNIPVNVVCAILGTQQGRVGGTAYTVFSALHVYGKKSGYYVIHTRIIAGGL